MLTLYQAIFGQHKKTKSISTTRAETTSIDLNTKNKSFSTRTQKPCQFRSSRLKPSQFRSIKGNQVIFGPLTKPKSIWPPHKEQVKFDPDAKTKSIAIPHIETKLISTPSLKLSHFRPPLYYQIDFDAPT